MSAVGWREQSLRLTSRPGGWRPQMSAERLLVVVCAWFVLTGNGPFWAAVAHAGAPLGLQLSLGVAMLALHAILIGLFAWGRSLRPLLIVLVVVTAAASWYMDRYAVVFNADMIRNVLQTDPAETREMISADLLLHMLIFGLLPAAFVLWTRLPAFRWQTRLRHRLLFLLGMSLLATAALASASQGVFALMRSEPALRYQITPGNYLVAFGRALAQDKTMPTGPRKIVAADAHRATTAATQRPRLVVLVIGETVRADHWGLNGYERQTTPKLAARDDVINFPDVTACGTSTAVSLPCMFSIFGREHYDRAAIAGHESLLDVLARVGVTSLWRDNQAGCKGVCAGVETQTMATTPDPRLCQAGRCLDEILLQGLEARIDATPGDLLVVLHPLGNHGPNYFERYPPAYEHFLPTCHSAELNHCSLEEIVNAYDNAVLYADTLLARLIDMLAADTSHDTAMLYLSDHGESLGEYGLFLHGAPYAVAPQAQLRVPMVFWMSPEFARSTGVDRTCLAATAAQPRSHDDLFHSVLGMFDVISTGHLSNHDFLYPCRAPGSPPPEQPHA